MAIIKKTITKVTYIKEEYNSGLISLEEAKAKRIADIKAETYKIVTKYMPEWKQISYNKFLTLYERVQNNETLSGIDQAFYNNFPDKGETHQEFYNKCVSAIGWILTCIQNNDNSEGLVLASNNIDELVNVPDPVYPAWPI